MKGKVLSLLYCIFLYAAQLPFVLMIILSSAGVEMSDAATGAVCFVCIAFAACAAVMIVVNAVVAVKYNLIRGVCPYAVTFGLKIALVPFFVINFIVWLLIYLATIHPVLVFVMALFMAVSVIVTYIFMLGGSMWNIAYIVRRLIKNFKVRYIFFLLMHFIFLFDVAAAIILRYCEGGEGAEETGSAPPSSGN